MPLPTITRHSLQSVYYCLCPTIVFTPSSLSSTASALYILQFIFYCLCFLHPPVLSSTASALYTPQFIFYYLCFLHPPVLSSTASSHHCSVLPPVLSSTASSHHCSVHPPVYLLLPLLFTPSSLSSTAPVYCSQPPLYPCGCLDPLLSVMKLLRCGPAPTLLLTFSSPRLQLLCSKLCPALTSVHPLFPHPDLCSGFSSGCLQLICPLLWSFTASSLSPPRWPSGKASASRAEGPWFESRLRRDFFRGRVIPVT